jgi:hypothetical protein
MKILPKLNENTIQFNNWIYPDNSDLELEYRIEYIGHEADPFDTFSTSDEFVDAVHNSKSYKITQQTDNRIDYRSHTIDQDDLLDMIGTYRSYPEFRNEDTVQAIYDGFRNNSPMKMPILMRFPNGKVRILGGNTRADVAMQLLGYYQAIVLEIPEQKCTCEYLTSSEYDFGRGKCKYCNSQKNENINKIIPIIKEDENYTYLKKDVGNYRDMIDSDITTTEPVEDTLAGTKSPTSDEIGNIRTRNNYWWSRTTGSRNMNCSTIILKKDLREHYSKLI